jgi:anthranilate/para-aminobenzoate synthase component II
MNPILLDALLLAPGPAYPKAAVLKSGERVEMGSHRPVLGIHISWAHGER